MYYMHSTKLFRISSALSRGMTVVIIIIKFEINPKVQIEVTRHLLRKISIHHE